MTKAVRPMDALWGAVKNLEKEVCRLSRAANEHAGFKAVRERFCVIGDKAKGGFSNMGRTWHASKESAEQYAASLIRNQPGHIDELLVVKVVSKVSKKHPEIRIEEDQH